MTDFKRGMALGIVLMWFLAGPISTVLKGIAMWAVLAIAIYLAFIAK